MFYNVYNYLHYIGIAIQSHIVFKYIWIINVNWILFFFALLASSARNNFLFRLMRSLPRRGWDDNSELRWPLAAPGCLSKGLNGDLHLFVSVHQGFPWHKKLFGDSQIFQVQGWPRLDRRALCRLPAWPFCWMELGRTFGVLASFGIDVFGVRLATAVPNTRLKKHFLKYSYNMLWCYNM